MFLRIFGNIESFAIQRQTESRRLSLLAFFTQESALRAAENRRRQSAAFLNRFLIFARTRSSSVGTFRK